ncbi:hypothetical protein SAMN05216533_6521 [Streptomyces sp. Ag109_O5-10]|nr:hypothetical protein SAMN05216533_6521 [Streptomyces sp. Ag109_O5-10]
MAIRDGLSRRTEETGVLGNHGLDVDAHQVEAVPDVFTGEVAGLPGRVRLCEQPPHQVGELGGQRVLVLTGRDQSASALAQAADAGGDHGPGRAHRLQRGEPHGLVEPGRVDDDRRLLVELAHVVDARLPELDVLPLPLAEPVVPGEPFQSGAEAALLMMEVDRGGRIGQNQTRPDRWGAGRTLRTAVDDLPQHRDRHCGALVRNEPGRQEDDGTRSDLSEFGDVEIRLGVHAQIGTVHGLLQHLGTLTDQEVGHRVVDIPDSTLPGQFLALRIAPDAVVGVRQDQSELILEALQSPGRDAGEMMQVVPVDKADGIAVPGEVRTEPVGQLPHLVLVVTARHGQVEQPVRMHLDTFAGAFGTRGPREHRDPVPTGHQSP